MTNGISLHIGLNSVSAAAYGGWSGKLNACEADANDMEALAKNRGFGTTKLLTRAGTRDNVLPVIKSAASKLVSGDIFFLTYSGHGGQLPDLNGDEDDNQDETWCLYDGELVDDELNSALCAFKSGVRVLVLSDSCHSGTATRAIERKADNTTFDAAAQVLRNADGVAIRMMPAAYLLGAYYAQKKAYDKVLMRPAPSAPRASVLLISGCQDNQTSLDGNFNGLFTGTLKSVWGDGTFEGSYRALHKAIVTKMPESQRPAFFQSGASNPKFIAQTPFTV
ncbi:MAG: caspase family protein [Nitrospira sp.]|nr:caspase family protein [Nitrospira sp.]